MTGYYLALGFLLFVLAVVAAGALIAFGYAMSRAVALGWFKTKLEHLRQVAKHFGKNGDAL